MNHPVVRADLLRVHAEDASLLIGQRAVMTEAPQVTFIDLYEHDRRLAGHLDYLRMCGTPSVTTAAEIFTETPEPSEAAIYAYLAMQSKSDDFVTDIFAQTDGADAAIRGLAQAFSYCDTATRRRHLGLWVQSDDPRLVCVAIEAAMHLRLKLHDLLGPFMQHEDHQVRACALQYAGVMGLTGQAAVVSDALDDGDADIAFAARLAACRLGIPAGAAPLITMIGPELPADKCRMAVEVGFAMLGQEGGRDLVRDLLSNADTRRWGVLGLGVIGATRILDFLIAEMDNPVQARIAGWAFSMVTGANVAEDDLELDVFPDDAENPIVDDPKSIEESFLEDSLPWPDGTRVNAWMAAHGSALSAQHPLLFGAAQQSYQHMDPSDLVYQGRYRSLAQLLAVRDPAARLANWRGPVIRQDTRMIRDWQV